MDALTHFPKNAERLKTEVGIASLIKTDIFKGLMFYVYDSGNKRGKFYPLSLQRVRHVLALNSKGETPTDLVDLQTLSMESEKTVDYDADDLTGVIELPPEERKNRRRNRSRNRNRNRNRNHSQSSNSAGKNNNGTGQGGNKKKNPGDNRNKKPGDNRKKK